MGGRTKVVRGDSIEVLDVLMHSFKKELVIHTNSSWAACLLFFDSYAIEQPGTVGAQL